MILEELACLIALFELDGGCFVCIWVLWFSMHVVCLFLLVCYAKTCVNLLVVRACNGALVFSAAGSCLFLMLYYVATVDSVGSQGSFQDWEHLFDGKTDANVQSDQILDCGDD